MGSSPIRTAGPEALTIPNSGAGCIGVLLPPDLHLAVVQWIGHPPSKRIGAGSSPASEAGNAVDGEARGCSHSLNIRYGMLCSI